jgi:hypothetical protein
MPTEERMTIDERRKYLKLMQRRYCRAERPEQGQLLDEMLAVTGLHRKSLIRLLHAESLARRPRPRQRGRTYNHTLDDALRVMAETEDYICAERLQPILPWLAQTLAHHGELELTPELRAQLESISISTVRRRLAHFGQDLPRLPRKPPSRTPSLVRAIPTRRIPWDEPVPGHFEADSVHHCGLSPVGDYVYTVQLIDVASGWSERVAVFGRSQRAMEAGLRHMQARLPFPILELHPDNGGEFLNNHLFRFYGDTVPGLHLSRSRPYHKNDNRFVEQKNHSLVRVFFGKARFDTRVHQRLLDALYDQMWLYYNFFQPVLHLIEKERRGDGSEMRYRRKWGEAQTPFERICAAHVLDGKTQEQLTALRGRTNPRHLRQEIYRLRDQLFDLPLASSPADQWLIPPDEEG